MPSAEVGCVVGKDLILQRRVHYNPTFTITAGEKVETNNRLVLEVSVEGRPTCIYVPVVLLG